MPVDVVVSDDNQSRTAAIVAYDDDPSDWSPSSEFGCVMPKVEYVGHNTSDKVKPCRVSFDWGELRDGTWRLVPDVRERLGSNSGQVTCTYRPVILIDDFKISHGAVVSLNDGQRVDHDVIEVSCSIDGASRRGRKRAFSKVYAQLLEKSEPEVENKLPVDSECKPLSVLLISYDSVSHVSWIKRLPKSYAYMRDIMKFDVFDGYNIVGDGTPGGKQLAKPNLYCLNFHSLKFFVVIVVDGVKSFDTNSDGLYGRRASIGAQKRPTSQICRRSVSVHLERSA